MVSKKMKKKRGPSKHVKLLHERQKEIERQKEMIEGYNLDRAALRRADNEKRDKIIRLDDQIEQYQEDRELALMSYYELGQLATSLRKKWIEAEKKLSARNQTYTVQIDARMADGCDDKAE